MNTIFKRITEPSSLAGLSALALALGVPVGMADGLVKIIAGVTAVAAVLIPERKAP